MAFLASRRYAEERFTPALRQRPCTSDSFRRFRGVPEIRSREAGEGHDLRSHGSFLAGCSVCNQVSMAGRRPSANRTGGLWRCPWPLPVEVQGRVS
jgi:hypothetical protein